MYRTDGWTCPSAVLHGISWWCGLLHLSFLAWCIYGAVLLFPHLLIYGEKPDRLESEVPPLRLTHIVKEGWWELLPRNRQHFFGKFSFGWSEKPCHLSDNSNYRKSIVRHQPYWSHCTGTGQGKVPMNNVRVSHSLPTSVRGISSRQKDCRVPSSD